MWTLIRLSWLFVMLCSYAEAAAVLFFGWVPTSAGIASTAFVALGLVASAQLELMDRRTNSHG